MNCAPGRSPGVPGRRRDRRRARVAERDRVAASERAGMTDETPTGDEVPDDVRARLDDLHAHLDATAELPVRPGASAWLGEAAAVAADLTRGTPDAAVVRERVGHVADLLSEAGETGHPEADDRVAAAREAAEEVRAALS